MGSLIQDFRYAARALLARPLLMGVVVITLALGVGMNTAIFSVVNGVLLKPLDYREPHRLVEVTAPLTRREGQPTAGFSVRMARELRERVDGIQEVALLNDIRQNLTGAGPPRQVVVGWTDHRLFPLLGVEAALGRTFAADEPPGTVLLSDRLWREQFGGDPGALGTSLRLDGHTYTVAGVLPPGFRIHVPGVADPDLWKNPDDWWQNGDVWADGEDFELAFFRAVARLGPGTEPARMQAQLDAVAADLRAREPEAQRDGLEIQVVNLQERIVSGVRPALLLLSGAVALVLLIACANVANLLLVRAQGRTRELAVRLALGGSRWRVGRLLLMESLILALLGGGAGVFLGAYGTRLLDLAGPAVPRAEAVSVDPTVLGFALLVTLGCTVLVGLAPAVGAGRQGVSGVLRSSRGVAGSGERLRNVLVVTQISLSLVLLIGTGLLTASFVRLQSVETGFDGEGVLTFAVSLPGARYDRPEGSDRFFRELEDRLEELPGVQSAGVMWPIPLAEGRWRRSYEAGPFVGEEAEEADFMVGTETYFETLGIRVVDGRLFEPSDPREVVVINRGVAERAWPGESGVGRTLRADPWGGGMSDFQIIGVVEDVRMHNLQDEPPAALYFDTRGWSWTDWEFNVLARAGGSMAALIPAVRELVTSMDPEVPVADVATMAERIDLATAPNRFALALVGLFSLVAGILALVGLYGVVSYSVGMRTREIGVRMALGSAAGRVVALVLGQGMRLVAVGVGIGVLGAVWLTRFLAEYLYQIEATDPTTYAGLALLLGGLAAVASWIPARRAARVDPAEVLRAE